MTIKRNLGLAAVMGMLTLAMLACRGGATATPVSPKATASNPGAGPTRQAPTPQPAADTAVPALGNGSTQVSPADGMVQVYVPAGNFILGSSKTDTARQINEKTQRTVYLDAYWIDQTDVTNAMYAQCVQAGQCQTPSKTSSQTRSTYYGDPQYDHYPVIFVSWDDAMAYCTWAGRRLPTEAEWEKAARGTDGRPYPWGKQAPDATLANFGQPNTGDTTEVGKFPAGASPYGALDMAGNVWQWVNDWYSDKYSPPAKNPPGATTGDYRVLRGGSWLNDARGVRATYPYWGTQDLRNANVFGFRCASTP
jgi:eukaryotic-like serine/threonine-protein kinase